MKKGMAVNVSCIYEFNVKTFIFQLPHSISLCVTFGQLRNYLIFVFICFSFQEKKNRLFLSGSDQKQIFDRVSGL